MGGDDFGEVAPARVLVLVCRLDLRSSMLRSFMHCFQAPARRMLSVSVPMLFAVLLSGCGGGSGPRS